MASKTTLNAKNLEALGAEHLAQLLIKVSTGNATAKRWLRLALAGAQSPKEVALEMSRRIAVIELNGCLASAGGTLHLRMYRWSSVLSPTDFQRV